MRPAVFVLLCVSLSACLSSCQSPGALTPVTQRPVENANGFIKASTAVEDGGVFRSARDPRQYRYLQLDNGLQVVLVHDASLEQAAASLIVDAGSRHDPVDAQGLAHFLEHMLFLGTREYPEVGGYQRFISENGGSTNAYTSLEKTKYFFSVNPASLGEALKRFSGFFVSPLFDADYVQRELQAVEAEYRAGLGQPGRQVYEVLQTTFVDEHPFKKLSVGNLQTLQGENLLARLKVFHQQHYTANNMALAVVGPQSLAWQVEQVETLFSRIAATANGSNKQEEIPPLFGLNAQLGDEANSSRVLHIKVDKPLRQLRLNFLLPDLQEHYSSKSLALIASVLGDESAGSLSRNLKNRGLIEGLWAGVGLRYKGGTLFSVTINATDKGMASIPDIVRAFFLARQHLLFELRVNPGRVLAQFSQQKQLSALNFRFYKPPSSLQLANVLSSNLQFYPPQHVIMGDYYHAGFDRELLERLLSDISPEKLLLVIASDKPLQQRYAMNAELIGLRAERNSPTPWYGAQHWQEWVNWADIDDGRAAGWQPALPQSNTYIPDDFALVKSKDPENRSLNRPVKVIEAAGYELWRSTDIEFELPEMQLHFAFWSHSHTRTARDAAMLRLYSAWLNDQLEPEVYLASQAGLGAQFVAGARGLSLALSGYSDGLPELFKRSLEVAQTAPQNKAQFERLKSSLQRRWRSAVAAIPHVFLGGELSAELSDKRWTKGELLNSLETVQFSDLQQFARDYWHHSYAVGLLHGNVNDDAENAIATELDAMRLCRCDKSSQSHMGVTAVDGGLTKLSRRVSHADNALLWYFQSPGDSHRDAVLTELVARALDPLYYTSLRTEQQLGYVVYAQLSPVHRQPGLFLGIQSPNSNVDRLHDASETFLQRFLQQYLTEERFAQYRQVLRRDLAKKDKRLSARTYRYWQSLMLGDESFAIRQQRLKELEALSYRDWVAYAEQLFVEEQRSLFFYTADDEKLAAP